MMSKADPSQVKDNLTISKSIPWSKIPWIGFVAGIFILGQLYYQASQGAATYLFARFWLGMLLYFIPLFWRQLSSDVSRFERISLLVATALFSYLPKLFRCPTYFCYSDELTWWRGVQDLIYGNPLLTANPLGEVQEFFPGLPLITILLQKASGLSTFQTGFVLIGFVHLLALISIFILGEKIFHSSKVGALAALLYSTNPAIFFFSTQFHYESLAVPMMLLSLLFVQSILTNPAGRLGRAWIVTIFLSIAALVITHHLSALMLLAILTLMVLAAEFLPRISWFQKSSRQLNLITLFAYGFTFGWIAFVAWDVFRYIGDPFLRGMQQISGHTVRQLFSGTQLPFYEVIAGYLAAVFIGLLALSGGLLIYRTKKVLFAAQIGLLAFGSLYFITAPLVLTSWGSEAGRRSWIFSFISLSLLAGFALAWFLAQQSIGKFPLDPNWLRRITTGALVLLLVGGVATSTTISYRFPGEYLYNSDARSYTPEMIDAAQWLFTQAGANNRVLGDRTTERIFGSYGFQEPAMLGGPRPWEVFLPTSWTGDAIYWLAQAEAPFVVVDKRMAELSPQMDIRFQRGEPSLDYSDRPLPSASIRKFDQLAQLDRLFDSGNIRVYAQNNLAQYLPESSRGEHDTSYQSSVGLDLEKKNTNYLTQLFDFLRSILLIALLLILPGIVVGKTMFPSWSSLDRILRFLLGVSLSISLIILTTVIFAWIFPTVEIATNTTLILLGFVLVIGLIQLIENINQAQPNQQKISTYVEQILEKIRSSNYFVALGIGMVGLFLVVLITGHIKPAADPRTVFALDFSTATPTLQINNLEREAKSYSIKINSKSRSEWSINPIVLDPHQSRQIYIPKSFLSIPAQEVLFLELYLNEEAASYRSLHFVPNPIGPGTQQDAGGS